MIIIVIWGNTNRVVSKGPLYDSNTKTVTLLMFPGEISRHKATTDAYFWGRSCPQFANLVFGNNPV